MDCQEVAKTVGWLGETWGFWIQTGALFLSAAGAIAVIYYNGKQARLRAFIDLIVHQKSDRELTEAIRAVNAMQASGEPLTKHLCPKCKERKQILKVLNNHEFIAVGIRLGAFDEHTYKQLQCSNVLYLWAMTEGYIAEIRKEQGKKTLFQDFENMAKRWEKDPIKLIQK